jgi:PilZ domain
MNSTQKRRYRRYEVHDLYGSLLFRVEVKVLNLSLTGMAVEATQQLKLGRLHAVRLGTGGSAISVDATVRWCRLVGTRKGGTGEPVTVYLAGLTFDGMVTEKAENVMEFLKEHVVLALEKRVIGRFRPKGESPIELAARVEFEVAKVSLSGMLLKTRFMPTLETTFDVEMTLAGSPFESSCRVAYVDRNGGSEAEPEATVGVEFVRLGEPQQAVLRQFITRELE